MPRRRNIERTAIKVAIFAGLLLAATEAIYPQSDCFGQRDITVSDLHGQVFDPSGEPISGASIAASQDEKEIATTTTNSSGNFGVEKTDGNYWLKVSAPGFSSASIRVNIRRGASAKPIRVILGVGLYAPCPSATLSNKEFKGLIKKYQDQIKADASKK
jgi:Carboxypeptidase regulatory-like domain